MKTVYAVTTSEPLCLLNGSVVPFDVVEPADGNDWTVVQCCQAQIEGETVIVWTWSRQDDDTHPMGDS